MSDAIEIEHAMSNLTQLVEKLWSHWPPIPAEELAIYMKGQVDGDNYTEEEIDAITNLTDPKFDCFFIHDATPSVMYRIVGCVCYQVAQLLEGTIPAGVDLIICLVRSLHEDITRSPPKVTSEGQPERHMPWSYSIADSLSGLDENQLLLFKSVLDLLLLFLLSGERLLFENQCWTQYGDLELIKYIPKVAEALSDL